MDPAAEAGGARGGVWRGGEELISRDGGGEEGSYCRYSSKRIFVCIHMLEKIVQKFSLLRLFRGSVKGKGEIVDWIESKSKTLKL